MPKDGDDTQIDLSAQAGPGDPAAENEAMAVQAETPRDERHDSIDPATGTLTDEAVELRRAMAEAASEE